MTISVDFDLSVYNQLNKISKWLENQYGEGYYSYFAIEDKPWGLYQYSNVNKIRLHLPDEESYLLFLLTWS